MSEWRDSAGAINRARKTFVNAGRLPWDIGDANYSAPFSFGVALQARDAPRLRRSVRDCATKPVRAQTIAAVRRKRRVLWACRGANYPTRLRALLLSREQTELRPRGRSTSRRLDF